jgi:maleate isomerase
MTPRFVPAHRAGLLVPSANPAVEPEFRALMSDTVALHAARLPVLPGMTLAERNAAYPETFAPTLGSFGTLPLQAAAVALTGASYAHGPAEDAAFAQRLSKGAGYPVVLASRAIADALAALGAEAISLFSPYPDWLSARAAAYWRAAGYRVSEISVSDGTFRAYEMTAEEVTEALARVPDRAGVPVVLSGTGMPTLDAIAAALDRAGPVISSNLATAWALTRALGLPPSPVLAALAPSLCLSRA